jgi:hypothetical protein
MKSTATDVAAYIAEAPPERQSALRRLRSLCRELRLPPFTTGHRPARIPAVLK